MQPLTVQRTTAKPVILLTGFGPFPGVEDNATSRLVPRLVDEARLLYPAFKFVSAVLATEWRSAPEQLSELVDTHRPGAAIHFGVAKDATGFRLERRALNVCRMAVDAAGRLPEAEHIMAGGPESHAVPWPTDAILRRLTDHGLPATTSDDAGGYLCNALLYHSLAGAAGLNGRYSSGFVHIPADLSKPPLTFDDAIKGALIIVGSVIELIEHRR